MRLTAAPQLSFLFKMKENININLTVPQADLRLLEKLSEKMGWKMTHKVSSPTSVDKVALLQRLYGCIQLPDDFDYKAALSDALNQKYCMR